MLALECCLLSVLAVSSDPASAQKLGASADKPDQIRGGYVAPKDAKFTAMYDALREQRVLERLRELLSPLRLPPDRLHRWLRLRQWLPLQPLPRHPQPHGRPSSLRRQRPSRRRAELFPSRARRLRLLRRRRKLRPLPRSRPPGRWSRSRLWLPPVLPVTLLVTPPATRLHRCRTLSSVLWLLPHPQVPSL